jgi:hypothetical protein
MTIMRLINSVLHGAPNPAVTARGTRLPATAEYEYLSRLMVAKPGDGGVESSLRYYRMKFSACGAQVVSAGMETSEIIRDPDTAVRAIFYQIRLYYLAATPVPDGSMD